jgi:hypothetical protein
MKGSAMLAKERAAFQSRAHVRRVCLPVSSPHRDTVGVVDTIATVVSSSGKRRVP